MSKASHIPNSMQCDKCFYFEQYTSKETGNCHRYPPLIRTWPRVDTKDYCGEFQPLPAPPLKDMELPEKFKAKFP